MAAYMVGKRLLLELVVLLLLWSTGSGTAGTGRSGSGFGRPRQVQLVQRLARRKEGGLGVGRTVVLVMLQAWDT